MTLILSNEDVDKLLTMPECIDVLEEAYVELAEGRGITRTRSDCITPTQHAGRGLRPQVDGRGHAPSSASARSASIPTS